MQLADLLTRSSPPSPWAEGEKIPWNDPGFSSRMLREHLSQEHDTASRRSAIIDRQVAWICQDILNGKPASVLDLGCGPGLYTSRLARLGCTCTGIDFSPASIAYARLQAQESSLNCQYIESDLRTTPFGTGFGLVMFIFGELNVFRPLEAQQILHKAYQALASGGLLVLEPHTFAAVKELGLAPTHWYTASAGLFSPDPHLCLQENFWDASTATATQRYYILDVHTASLVRYAATMQAYTNAAYLEMLQACGFGDIHFHPSLEGKVSEASRMLMVITARK